MPTKVSNPVGKPPARQRGKNEMLYSIKYEKYVDEFITRCIAGHKRPDYRSMSDSDKKTAVECVDSLLSRLQTKANYPITGCNQTSHEAVLMNEESLLFCAGLSQRNDECGALPKSLFHTQDDVFDYGDVGRTSSERDRSCREEDQRGNSFMPGDDSTVASKELLHQSAKTDFSPVEIPRRQMPEFETDNDGHMLFSPSLQSTPLSSSSTRKKRAATTSGKKGEDTQRMRAEFDSPGNASEYIDSPPQRLDPSTDSLSFLACASQSPIEKSDDMKCLQHINYGESPNARRSLPFNEDESKRSGGKDRQSLLNDTIESVNCTVLPRRARNRDGKNSLIEEAPADIRLKNGSFYRLDPLRVRRPQKQRSRRRSKSADAVSKESRQLLSIPDPFSTYHERLAGRLSVVADWIIEKDGEAEAKDKLDETDLDDTVANDRLLLGKGVLISMSSTNITAVCMKMLLAAGANPHRRSCNVLNGSTKTDTLKGGTLIILRTKSETEKWECSLREGTSFSVLNHASLPSTERKRAKTRLKCAGFDVVLTTYDALKAREKTTAVDGRGRAVMSDGTQDGWYSSRSGGDSQPQKCETISTLHGMIWYRAIFVDLLGRASYISKPGTARSTAAIALRARARFIFFACSSEDDGVLETKLREDRKQLCSIASVLHLSEERAAERVVGDALLDLKDIQESTDDTFMLEESCSTP